MKDYDLSSLKPLFVPHQFQKQVQSDVVTIVNVSDQTNLLFHGMLLLSRLLRGEGGKRYISDQSQSMPRESVPKLKHSS